MSNLVYIHGFRSSPLSEKSRQFKKVFPDILLATYDTLHPDIGFHQLDEIVTSALPHNPLLIGSSLGGFWAYQFAKQYGLRCVLLNPCMSPEVTLKPDIGVVTNMYTGEQGLMQETDLLSYDKYRSSGEPAQCVVLHEKGDELIPYQESIANFEGKAKLVLIAGGSHSFEHLEVALEEISLLLN
ncbi:MAG TPA: YqiA/YcfP family alpha/beta fold hydrolase [Methylophilaceae bacterium]|nr:YqiA/YcfP family alpha/beta fold hydrolase [Methylophilaceae bacterium]